MTCCKKVQKIIYPIENTGKMFPKCIKTTVLIRYLDYLLPRCYLD